MKTCLRFSILIVLLLLAACSTLPTPGATSQPEDPATPDPATPTTLPEAQWSGEDLAGLDPHDVVVQLDYEPTFSLPELFYEFGRVPPFTLLADGTVIYVDEGQTFEEQVVLQARLSPQETARFAQSVLETGFERLQSHTSDCKDLGDGTSECVADASFTILRSRIPGGSLREVKIFYHFTDEPEIFEALTALMQDYQHPDGQPYRPHGATLFIRPMTEAIGVTVSEWPLDPALLVDLQPLFAQQGMAAVPIAGGDLNQFLSLSSSNTGSAYFEREGQFYATFLTPWLPGVDFAAEIAAQFPIPEPSGSAGGAIFGACPLAKGEFSAGGKFRLAYVSQGDLWLWDQGREPQQLTATADIGQLRLSESGSLLVFTRRSGQQGDTLWAIGSDGSGLRQLAGGAEMAGTISILEYATDQARIAFSHHLADGGGELWAANTDGSGSRRLVSQEDLMRIVSEPMADFAEPEGVHWIPGTHRLIYDAGPRFDEDGIYIFVQRQNWVVDADSGSQQALLPAGEGGMASFSPDGKTMTISTPENLRFLNLESGEIRQAGLRFFAVGFGEFYSYPPLAWTPDSKAVLLAQPEEDAAAFDHDAGVGVWRVPVDGSRAQRLLDASGFFPTFAFSPDQAKVAYWRWTEPNSNHRELHIASLDGREHVVYETGDMLEFQAWSPDSQHFVYRVGEFPGQLLLGHLCAASAPLAVPAGTLDSWLDAGRFVFVRSDSDPLELNLVSLNGALSYLGSFEGAYDYVIVP